MNNWFCECLVLYIQNNLLFLTFTVSSDEMPIILLKFNNLFMYSKNFTIYPSLHKILKV